MEKTRGMMVCLLIVSAAAVGANATPGKNVMSLFQDALYQEQTEGNLDKAIELYQKVVDESEEVEKLAARATFQLGMCYLKKGNQDEAVKHFKKILSQYPAQKDLAEKAQKQLEKISPQGVEAGIFSVIPQKILEKVAQMYGTTSTEAGQKGLYSNAHIHYVDAQMNHYSGGFGYYLNTQSVPIQQKICLTGTSNPDLLYYDVAGRKMDVEIVPVEKKKNFYTVYWAPQEPVGPGQFFFYGWTSKNEGKKLQAIFGGKSFTLIMQNFYGSHVLETFYLVLPDSMGLKASTEDCTTKESFEGHTIYSWKKDVPQNTNHVVTATLIPLESLSPEDIASRVENAVTTISTCAETDPKVQESLDKLKGLKSEPVVKGLTSYLDSETATIRRSAIFILWRGEFSDISAAEEKLIALCGHEEQYTRGMAALALGQNKVAAAYDVLAKMTIDDKDGYARRCGAYALGLLGDEKALPVLEKALKDSDDMVKQNAQAAITMLTKLKEIESPSARSSKSDKLLSEDLAAEGWKLWGQQQLTEAEKKFEEAVAADPTNDNAYQGLGWAQFNQGKNKNAEASFTKCIERNPKNSAALNGLGWIANAKGDKDEAIAWWEKAVKAMPGATASLSGLTQVYMEKEDYQNAIKYYKMWLKVEPNNQEARDGLIKAGQMKQQNTEK